MYQIQPCSLLSGNKTKATNGTGQKIEAEFFEKKLHTEAEANAEFHKKSTICLVLKFP